MFGGRFTFSLFLLTFSFARVASADTLDISSSPGANPIIYSGVLVSRIENGKLYFQTPEAKDVVRPLSSIVKMRIDDEPAFNEAESAFGSGKWDAATDNYEKVLRLSSKAWLKDFATVRLLECANKAKRFDAAVRAFISVVGKDSKVALANKPILPDATSTFLESAQTDLNSALSNSKLTDEQKHALLSLQLDIQRLRKDPNGASTTLEQLSTLAPPATAGADAAKNQIELKLGSAQVAIQKKDYQKALADIESVRTLLTDPAQQADALWCIAEARAGLAAESRDPAAIKDAALAYLRVVAHFKDAPEAPHVPEALLKAGQLLEQLKDSRGALALYQQITARYSTSSSASPAQQRIAQLTK